MEQSSVQSNKNMSSCSSSQQINNQIHRQSVSSTSDEDEDFIDEDDSNVRSKKRKTTDGIKSKKTLGRVKIEMAYIDNKIRRYTTFSKRKTGIMKKAYELATLTGTEVMVLVASETGHVYTYATPKLQPMITSDNGKNLIQTCLAKDEPVHEPIIDNSIHATTLNNNDVIFIDENQRKKRTNPLNENPTADTMIINRAIKRPKLKHSGDLSPLHKAKTIDVSRSHNFSLLPPPLPPPQTTTFALPLPCFINSDLQQQQQQQQQQHAAIPSAYTVDLSTLKNNGMNIIFAPSTTNSSEKSSPSSIPLVLTLGNFPYQPT